MGRFYLRPDEFRYFASNRALQARLRTTAADVTDPKKSAEAHHRMYQRATVPFFKSVSPILGIVISSSNRTQAHDLFLWYSCNGYRELAMEFWFACPRTQTGAAAGGC